MPPADSDVDWDPTLRPWRRVAALVSVLQMLGMLALGAVVFLASPTVKGAGYAVAGAIVALEVGQWRLAAAALKRCPALDPDARYASLPLDQAQQRLVECNLVTSVLAPVLLALIVPTTSFKHEKPVVFVLFLAAFAPGYLSLWRVRRNRSWLAISRIPANPRRRPSH